MCLVNYIIVWIYNIDCIYLCVFMYVVIGDNCGVFGDIICSLF